MKNLIKTVTNKKIRIIAEIGTSHNGSIRRAGELISAAALAGADILKTQIIFADEIIHPNTGEVKLPGGRIRLYDRFRQLEKDFDFYASLRELTENAGLEFLASPFGLKSLDWLLRLGCDSAKIASPELNHFPLLEQAASSGLRLILSSGVSEMRDITAALETITSSAPPRAPEPVLLHCITAYPAPEKEFNLRLLETFYERFGVSVGVSDHSRNPVIVPVCAAALGAGYIEKHITLKNDDGGLDDPIALTPEQFRQMTEAVREVEKRPAERRLPFVMEKYGKETVEVILGDGVKRLAPSEALNYGRTNRSVHALHNLAAGTVLSPENAALLRTEKLLRPGMRPEYYPEALGRKILRPVASGQGIRLSDLA